jgi:polyphosphate glucokinase
MKELKVLVIDVGGTNVKLLASGHRKSIRFPSGKYMTPSHMVAEIRALTKDWEYDVVSMGYPGVVRRNKILTEPHNLAHGWIRYNFRSAFRRPVRIMNDAAMQALGSYRKGTMMFLGLGTGLGFAVVAGGVVLPIEAAHLSYKGGTFEHYMGKAGLLRMGHRKWTHAVALAVDRLREAIHPDDVVLGGGNSKSLLRLPKGCRLGGNKFAFIGGFRMWQNYLPAMKRRKKK